MSPRNRIAILLGVIVLAAAAYYAFSTPSRRGLALIGTVDANQVIVSPQVGGRLAELLVDEGTRVEAGQLIARIDPTELQAEVAAAEANVRSIAAKVDETRSTERSTQGSTTSDVANATAMLSAARAQLAQAEAALERTESDSRRTIALAKDGVASDQDRVQAETNLAAARANVRALQDQVTAARADRDSAVARTHQARAARSTVVATKADLANAEEQLRQARVRLGYAEIRAPVSGTVSIRAALQGEVLAAGQPICTIVDLGTTWVRAALPETEADHIGIGDTLAIRLPGGTATRGEVFFKAPEADFATQRDVSRRKRDIRTIVLKVRLANPNEAYVPGMTAEVDVSPEQLRGGSERMASERRP